MHVKTFSQKFAATAETSEGDGDTREAEEAPVTIFGTFASTNRQQHRGYVKYFNNATDEEKEEYAKAVLGEAQGKVGVNSLSRMKQDHEEARLCFLGQ